MISKVPYIYDILSNDLMDKSTEEVKVQEKRVENWTLRNSSIYKPYILKLETY